MYNQIYKSIKSQGNYSRKQENDFTNLIESNYKKYLNRSNQFVQKIIIENHPSTEDLLKSNFFTFLAILHLLILLFLLLFYLH